MSGLRLIFGISLRHLTSKIKQSAIAALGVMFGIGMYIIMLSFMTGLNYLLDGLVLNRTPHIQIYNKTETTELQPADRYLLHKDDIRLIHSIKPKSRLSRIHNALPLLSDIRKDPKIKGATPQATCRVFYLAGTNNLNGIINGVEVDEEMRLFNFKDYIVEGDANSLNKRKNNILLGAGIAKKLSLSVGDNLQVIGTNGVTYSLMVGGIFQSGLAEVDDVQSYTNLRMAQQILGVGNNFITRIHIKLYEMDEAVPLSHTIENLYDVKALDIKKANAQFETGSDIRTLISYAVSITLLIVAGFGIYNILNMLIYEKMDDIAILKATGFSSQDIMLVFIIQAILIGVIGGIMGICLGFGVSLIIDGIPFVTEALPTIKTYPINYDPMFYFGGFGFALICTFLAGFLPAVKASRIDPVEIIRGK